MCRKERLYFTTEIRNGGVVAALRIPFQVQQHPTVAVERWIDDSIALSIVNPVIVILDEICDLLYLRHIPHVGPHPFLLLIFA